MKINVMALVNELIYSYTGKKKGDDSIDKKITDKISA